MLISLSGPTYGRKATGSDTTMNCWLVRSAALSGSVTSCSAKRRVTAGAGSRRTDWATCTEVQTDLSALNVATSPWGVAAVSGVASATAATLASRRDGGGGGVARG